LVLLETEASPGGDDASAHGGELRVVAEGWKRHSEDRRPGETPHAAAAVKIVIAAVVVDVQLVDAVAVLVVIKHNVQMPLRRQISIGLGVRIAVGVGGVSSRADQVAAADNGGQLVRMAARGEEGVSSTGK
jgi:hypothetical protein